MKLRKVRTRVIVYSNGKARFLSSLVTREFNKLSGINLLAISQASLTVSIVISK